MSANRYTAAAGLNVLHAIARLLRASPHAAENPDWAELRAGCLDDIATAVGRDAALDPEQLANSARWAGTEWESSLTPIFFGLDQTEEIDERIRTDRVDRTAEVPPEP